MLMACTSPQPSVFTPQLSGRKLSPPTGVGSASLRVWPGARAFRNSPRPRTSGSLWVSSSTPCSSGRTTQGHVLHGLSEVSSGAESHLPLVATCPFLSLPPSPTPGPVPPKTSSQITCLHSSLASALASGGTLSQTADLGFSFCLSKRPQIEMSSSTKYDSTNFWPL